MSEAVTDGTLNLKHRAKFCTKPLKCHHCRAEAITKTRPLYKIKVLFLEKVCTKYAANMIQ